MAKSKISIIVTNYNNEKYLDKCLKSLVKQTMPEIEIICVDDCSTDNSIKVIEKFVQKDPRVQLLELKQNSGPSVARNLGIEKAKSDFIMFCDADDYYEFDACEELYNAIIKSKADLAIGRIGVIYNAHAEMKRSDDNYYALKFDGLTKLDLEVIFKTDLAPTNKIFRKSIIEQNQIKFPEGLRFEDAYFCMAYFCSSKNAYYLNKKVYNYVRRKGSTMSNTWSKDASNDFAIDHLQVAIELYDFLVKNDKLQDWRETFWWFFCVSESFAIHNSKTRRRRKEVVQKAEDFITAHPEDFAKVSHATKREISKVTHYRKQGVINAVKKFILKLMPTWSFCNANIRKLQEVNAEFTRTIEKIAEE